MAAAYIASTSPSISSMVSPLARSATAKPAIWAGLASPARIWPIAQAVCSELRSARLIKDPSTSGQVDIDLGLGGDPRAQQPDHGLGELDRVQRV